LLSILSIKEIVKMDLRKLEAFCKVYENTSFSKAGRELYLSQSTISSHISALEDELGVLLFDRAGRSVLRTPAAQILYKRAVEVFQVLERSVSEIAMLHKKISGTLALGGSTIPANYLLPTLLADFCGQYRDVRIDLKVGDSSDVASRVAGGELMLGVVGAETNSPELKCIPVMSDSLVLVGAPGFAEAFDRLGEQGLWTKIPWVMREAGSGTRKALEKALLRQGVGTRSLNVSITVQNTEAMLRCLLAGMGVSVTSRMVVQDALAQGRLLELDLPALHFQRNFHVIYHRKRTLFPAGQRFLEFLQERLTFHGYPTDQGEIAVSQ